jgi:hypothetical protein
MIAAATLNPPSAAARRPAIKGPKLVMIRKWRMTYRLPPICRARILLSLQARPAGPMNSYAYYIYGVGHRTEDDCRPEDAFMQVPGEGDLQSTYVSLRGASPPIMRQGRRERCSTERWSACSGLPGRAKFLSAACGTAGSPAYLSAAKRRNFCFIVLISAT